MSWHCQDSLVRYKNHGKPRGHGFVECQADSQEQIVTKRNEETSQDNVKQGKESAFLVLFPKGIHITPWNGCKYIILK